MNSLVAPAAPQPEEAAPAQSNGYQQAAAPQQESGYRHKRERLSSFASCPFHFLFHNSSKKLTDLLRPLTLNCVCVREGRE